MMILGTTDHEKFLFLIEEAGHRLAYEDTLELKEYAMDADLVKLLAEGLAIVKIWLSRDTARRRSTRPRRRRK